MTNLNEIAAKAEALDIVRNANVWKGKRVYINLFAANRTWRGDRTYDLYYCAKRGWISEPGKGLTSRDFDAAVGAFEKAMGIEV